MSLSRYLASSSVLVLVALGCGDGDDAGQSSQDLASERGADGDEEQHDNQQKEVAQSADELALPCDVKEFLQVNCQRCHGAEAKNGTPLLSRDDLLAAAKKDPSLSVVERALLRMVDSEKPMPPKGKGQPVSEADLEMFTRWVDDGMPAGRCDEDFTPPAMMPATPATPATPAAP